jgi:hypothetical protein
VRTLTANNRMSPGLVSAAALGLLIFSVSAAADNKKPAPAAPAAPAAHAAAPAAHPAAAPAAGAHGPATSAAHGPTTAGGAHGATGAAGATSHAVTTTSAHASVTTGGAGAKPAAGGGYKPGSATAAAHPGAGGSTASHAAFGGHPAPANSHEMHAANGAAVRTRADGSRSDVHDPKRGMDIHHGLNGNRRVSVERADHSRIVAERGGRGYVQHPYMFHGREFGHRTYFEHGRPYDRFYGRYGWHGRSYDVYAPRAYYPYGFYGYAYAPWAAPVPYAWAPAPWVAPYGFYYAPYPVYPAPAFWLADFVFAASLAAAYDAGHNAGASGASLSPLSPEHSEYVGLVRFSAAIGDWLINSADAASASPALSQDIKQQVADEIKLLVQQEGDDAKTNGSSQDGDGSGGSVMKLFGDNRPHVFVAGGDLDVVAASGSECAISQGDVLRIVSLPAGDADSVTAAVLASKGGKECTANASVTLAMTDLQDMHNHMRESVDDGLSELQKKQGTGGLPAAPAGAAAPPVPAAFAKDAPPPEANAASEVAQQAKEADAAEQDVAKEVTATPGGAPAAEGQVNITLGQSIDSVTAALGSPVRIIDLGAKKIYAYKDMKITFTNGKVSDVQ